MHIPLDVEDTVAEAGLELGSHRTIALVDLYLVLVVDIAQSIITRDGMTAAGELILVNVLLADIDGFLAIELLRHDEEILFGLLFFLFLSDEGHVLEPAAALRTLVLAAEFVEILVAQDDDLLTEGLIELITFAVGVELCQTIGQRKTGFVVVLLKEGIQDFLTSALHLSVVATQDGLNLRLCLGCGDEVDPRRTDVLRF